MVTMKLEMFKGVFEKLANEAWKMWTSVVYDW